MKILLLSDTYSEHTEKWAIGLAEHGIKIGLFSFNTSSYPWFEKHKNKLRLHELKYKCLVYLKECEFKWYRWKRLQEARLFMHREFN